MKKILYIFAILLLTSQVSYASIDSNLKYGMSGQPVLELQDFLISQGYNTLSTGFFGLMTFNAVKEYQLSQNIPNTGFVGILTRTSINDFITVAIASSTVAETLETPQLVQPINTGNFTETFTPTVQAPITPPTPVIPSPTCTLVMEKVTNEGGWELASTTWSSENADTLVGVQTSKYGVTTFKNNNQATVYQHSNFEVPMRLQLTFTGKGGSVTCEAEVE